MALRCQSYLCCYVILQLVKIISNRSNDHLINFERVIIWNLSIHIKWFLGIECMIWKCRSYLFLEHCWFYTPLGIGLLGNRCKTIKQTLLIIWNNNTILTMILHLDYTVGIITKKKNRKIVKWSFDNAMLWRIREK